MPAELMQHRGLDGHSSSSSCQQHCSDIEGGPSAAVSADAAIAAGSHQPGRGSGHEVCARNAASAAPAAGTGAAVDGQHNEQAQHDTKGALDNQAAFCAAFVGNAPVHGDTYCYHVDADPAGLPPSRSAKPPHCVRCLACTMPIAGRDRGLLHPGPFAVCLICHKCASLPNGRASHGEVHDCTMSSIV